MIHALHSEDTMVGIKRLFHRVLCIIAKPQGVVLPLCFAAIGLFQHSICRGQLPSANPADRSSIDTSEASEPAVSKSDILEWIDQLDAKKAAQRNQAERLLINAGLKVLEYLPDSRSDFSIEANERLQRVRSALLSVKASQQSKAIRIRLGKTKTLGEALEAISRESQVEFEHNADESLPIQSSNIPLSFWHAVDLVLDQTN
ncbi:MAG: hypothetical protein AAF745_11850, partial [Planctomycetota bacterium]